MAVVLADMFPVLVDMFPAFVDIEPALVCMALVLVAIADVLADMSALTAVSSYGSTAVPLTDRESASTEVAFKADTSSVSFTDSSVIC